MPARRTQDVIEVVMTDHKIVRDPGPDDLTAPIAKETTEVAEVFLQDPHNGLDATQQVIYKATAVLRHTSGGADYAADALAAKLEASADPHFEPWLELARSQIRRGLFDEGLDTLLQAELRKPGHPKILEYRAVATFSKGERARAIALMRQLLDKFPDLAGQRFILAEMLQRVGNEEEAVAQAREAIGGRHTLWPAWHLLGEIAQSRGELEQAADAFKTALAIKPDSALTQKALSATLTKLGRAGEAARYRTRAPE
ncbi:tetratricopeptide repeat protein [Breoghania sp. L-A4]|uniref:tetratricopeptide repeat protein n=1 Tax=Breoghania sp. L-A4 TaxID=2304600 RepID=UPI000E35A835|nr:tetratricopeptide repeat protein [Breoghania sp. L-A4]AXS39376.1 tetratricopeptide repeat protein [Breoghania sp. L-A4]